MTTVTSLRRSAAGATLALLCFTASPALAQDEEEEKAITVSGSVSFTNDYRFRGVSQSDEEIAIQGGLTIAHKSGIYVGTWGSNLAGWGTFGGANTELDLIVGFSTTIGDAAIDTGVTWYTYPGGADNSDFFEGYFSVSGTTGPLSLTAAVNYAPEQEALGNFSATPFSNGQSEDNLYLSGGADFAIPNTPVTLSAHIGYSEGNPGLGPNGTSVAPTGEYWDWSLGASVPITGPLSLSVAYVDTDIGVAESAFLQPNFSLGNDGTGQIADAQLVIALTAEF
ncbi:TorF family putative porin [Parasphingorhabdus sp. DH2-15]|uniref:TorF family putative porin n=1 Tax=Parasphingorhabdus sp. DH2-15 TaxID=3444112 RepID=UPI003F683C81